MCKYIQYIPGPSGCTMGCTGIMALWDALGSWHYGMHWDHGTMGCTGVMALWDALGSWHYGMSCVFILDLSLQSTHQQMMMSSHHHITGNDNMHCVHALYVLQYQSAGLCE